MTQTDDSASTPEPAPRRRRWRPSVLLAILSLLLLLGGMAEGTHDSDSCCAIDCEMYPDVCAEYAREHARQEQTASVIALGAYVGSAVALGYAIVVLGRR